MAAEPPTSHPLTFRSGEKKNKFTGILPSVLQPPKKRSSWTQTSDLSLLGDEVGQDRSLSNETRISLTGLQ